MKYLKGGFMKRIFLLFAIVLFAISFVFAAVSGVGTGSDTTQTGQGTETQTSTETQNSGEESNLQNQIRVQSGNYENSNGEQMQIQTENGFRLKVEGVEAKSSMEINQEQSQNKTMLKTQLSNGKNAEIKVMPNTASEKAIQRLQLKVCSSENSCQIELKEVGTGEQVKVAYEVKAQKEAKVLGLFKTKMQVQAQVDAETGEIIQTKKPWWAFLASE
jgi:hypothetical protein